MNCKTSALALVLGLTIEQSVAGMIDKEGMAPWEICGLCHGLDGNSAMAKFPKLSGQKATYIVNQFNAFHAGKRTNDGGQMQSITGEVQPGDIDIIAAYFERQAAPNPATAERDDARYQHGKALFKTGRAGLPACVSCHRPERKDTPWLDSQHEDYLAKQLNDFRSGQRQNDNAGVMQQIAAELTVDEQEALVHFLSRSSYRKESYRKESYRMESDRTGSNAAQ